MFTMNSVGKNFTVRHCFLSLMSLTSTLYNLYWFTKRIKSQSHKNNIQVEIKINDPLNAFGAAYDLTLLVLSMQNNYLHS